MKPHHLAAVAIAGSTLLSMSCASRTATRTRDAFQATKTAPQGDGAGDGNGPAPAQTNPDRFALGWNRVAAILELSTQELATGDSERVLRLAHRWCASDPTPQDTNHGPVVVCFPEPPIQAGGHGFTLELGNGGMVGMVSAGLSGTESQKLTAEARREGNAWCVDSWRAVPPPQNAFQEFHTCSVDGGAVLTVGRIPEDLEADLWQVSVTLLGAT